VYREVARTLLAWYSRIVSTDGDISPGNAPSTAQASTPDADTTTLPDVVDIVAVHRRWAEQQQPYEAAAQTIVPFGRHRGKTLRQVGKREVRWLRERLIPEDVARETLQHIEVLLEPERAAHEPEQQRAARQARHPWRRQTGIQRKTRVSRAFQRSLDVKAPLVRLKTLSTEELLHLQAELEEMLEFSIQFAAIRDAVDLFLSPAPARYPTVHALLTDEQWHARQATYSDYLDTLATHIFEEQQAQADQTANDVQSAASDLGRPELQPLTFKRPMRPGVATFALLYSISTPDADALERTYRRMGAARRERKIAQVLAEGERYRYVLAVVIHGEHAFAPVPADQQADDTQENGAAHSTDEDTNDVLRIGHQPPERFVPHVQPGLFYVNYPHTPFTPPKGTSMLLFPVECGEHYHEQEFLRRIIARQRTRQEEDFVALHEKQREEQASTTEGAAAQQGSTKKLPDSKEAHFPRNAPLGSARILSQRTEYGYYDFSVHMPVEDDAPPVVQQIHEVVGFHEHAYGYSYARIDVEGNVLQVGDVAIAPHALPKVGDASYSDNYAYETVKAMIALARPGLNDEPPADTGAIIGLEHAAWKKQRVSLSREHNRLQFTRPSRKIATILGYKALQAGLLPPHDTIVSVSQCSACSARRDSSIRNIHPKTEHCPTCGATNLQETEPGSGELQCTRCECIWQEYEAWFVCPSCGHQQVARLNTAVVVAQHTLTSFARYYTAKARNRTTQQTTSE
jgi:predicted RNA-binding Zn-ribbon protein involved in translation (DUF1610 family)